MVQNIRVVIRLRYDMGAMSCRLGHTMIGRLRDTVHGVRAWLCENVCSRLRDYVGRVPSMRVAIRPSRRPRINPRCRSYYEPIPQIRRPVRPITQVPPHRYVHQQP